MKDPLTTGSTQPRRWDSMSAYKVGVRPAADNSPPAMSTRARSDGSGMGHIQNVKAKPMTMGMAESA
jgi:hypothetical protein